MRRSFHALASTLLAVLAACDGGGEAGPLAHPDQLQIRIVEGRGLRASVRPVGDQPADSLYVTAPVAVRVFLLPTGDEDEDPTGPARKPTLPSVTVRWRTIEDFCKPVAATTELVPGRDTTVNHYVRPTRSGLCRLIAEASVDGRPFGRPDTAAIHFDPGPPARMEPSRVVPFLRQRGVFIGAFRPDIYDAYGNDVLEAELTYTLARGAPVMSIREDLERLVATAEGYGAVTVTTGGLSATIDAWALEDLAEHWRLSWACYGLDLPGGAHVDSVHYRFDRAEGSYGEMSSRGMVATFTGNLIRREWLRGQPVRETVALRAGQPVAQKPGTLEWAPGQVSQRVGTGYVGGTLCEPGIDGAAWSRTSPVRVEPV